MCVTYKCGMNSLQFQTSVWICIGTFCHLVPNNLAVSSECDLHIWHHQSEHYQLYHYLSVHIYLRPYLSCIIVLLSSYVVCPIQPPGYNNSINLQTYLLQFIPRQRHIEPHVDSTPTFSVDSKLLRYFSGHADAFQILLYGVYPVLSWSSRLSLRTAYISVYSLSWQSVVVYSQNVPKPSQSSLFYDEIYLFQLRLHPNPLVTDCLSMRYPLFVFGTWCACSSILISIFQIRCWLSVYITCQKF